MKLTGRLYFLDALRGLAALSVMVFHLFAYNVSPLHAELAAGIPAWIGGLMAHMYCGVEVFFVLSGFVIAFAMDGQRTGARYAGNFILRRSLRLDPPYWAAMVLTLGYLLLRWPGQWHDFYLYYSGARGLAANCFYLQNTFFAPARSVLEVSWTLCLEVQFYLAFLVVLVAGYYAGGLAGRRAGAIQRGIVALAVTAVAAWSLLHCSRQPSFDFAGRAWTFFLGVGVYAALTRGGRPAAVALVLASLAALFLWQGEVRNVVTVAAAGAIYWAGMTGRLSTLLAFRPLLYLGRISYSLYLVHMVIGLNCLCVLAPRVHGSVTGAWLSVALAGLLALLGAQALHRLVEAPTNRLSQRLKPRRPAASALESEVEGAPKAAAAGRSRELSSASAGSL